jgi:tRNA uridine 5-carboxymethylaminomethyl modification enzyme
MAGINAALRLRREPPFVLARSEALIGVLIDDLTTRGTLEPYRMFTSRAEHRLLLRHGNADLRLSHHGARLGLVPPEALERVEARRRAIAGAVDRLERSIVDRVSLAQRLRRPGTALADLAALPGGEGLDALPLDVREEVEVEVKYAGYLERERLEVERLRRMEETPIPADVDYRAFSHLSNEGREKLARFRPATVGQASRVPGVSPADVSLLIVHLRRRGGAAVAG